MENDLNIGESTYGIVVLNDGETWCMAEDARICFVTQTALDYLQEEDGRVKHLSPGDGLHGVYRIPKGDKPSEYGRKWDTWWDSLI